MGVITRLVGCGRRRPDARQHRKPCSAIHFRRARAAEAYLGPSAFDEALNVRFDRYFTNVGPVAPDLAVFPPAPNVIQGRRLESCASPRAAATSIRPTGCRATRPRAKRALGCRCRGLEDRATFRWHGDHLRHDADEYIAWNHGDKSQAVQDRLRSSRSRYELYLRELGLTPEPVDTRSLGSATATMPTGGGLEPDR